MTPVPGVFPATEVVSRPEAVGREPGRTADRGARSPFEAAVRGARDARARVAEPPGARASAERFVASALLLPLMAEARGGALKSDLFGGGFAHDAMAQQLETHLADAVVKGANFPLVDRIVADAAGGVLEILPSSAALEHEGHEGTKGTKDLPLARNHTLSGSRRLPLRERRGGGRAGRSARFVSFVPSCPS